MTMHWVIQQNFFKPQNHLGLIQALNAANIPYHLVNIPRGTFELVPEIPVLSNVYICGALKMANIAQKRQWVPGSFWNENFSFEHWFAKLDTALLNAQHHHQIFGEPHLIPWSRFFVRPAEDNKSFDGQVITREQWELWQCDASAVTLQNIPVIMSPVQQIYREYRLFIVANTIVTGSVYRVAGKDFFSDVLEPAVLAYAETIIATWLPAESCVMDIACTEAGFKVIEFNHINSASFYASNIDRYVQAIQNHYTLEQM